MISQVAAYHPGWGLPWRTVGGYIYLWPEASYGRALFWFLMFYSVLYSAFNIGVTVLVLRKTFNSSNIQVIPLHPDKCGGLGGINQYSNRIALGIGSIGLMLSTAVAVELQTKTLLAAYPVILGVVAYILLAPLFFFLPLGTAHDAMREAKDAELLILSGRFKAVYDNVKKSVDKSNKRLEDESKKLENIKKLYDLAESFPVWPFDIQSLRRFMTIISTPLLPAIISILGKVAEESGLIKLIVKWIQPVP